jgi:hypothetical protein
MVRLMQILSLEKSVKEKLLLEFRWVKGDIKDYREVMP